MLHWMPDMLPFGYVCLVALPCLLVLRRGPSVR
jgi:hypothetical protein